MNLLRSLWRRIWDACPLWMWDVADWFADWFRGQDSPREDSWHERKRNRSIRLQYERLEERCMLSLSFGINDISVPEGAVAEYAIVRTGTEQELAAVSEIVYQVAGGSPNPATAGVDYNPAWSPAVVVFQSGETSKPLSFQTHPDWEVEPDEKLNVTIAIQSGGGELADATGVATITPPATTVTIADARPPMKGALPSSRSFAREAVSATPSRSASAPATARLMPARSSPGTTTPSAPTMKSSWIATRARPLPCPSVRTRSTSRRRPSSPSSRRLTVPRSAAPRKPWGSSWTMTRSPPSSRCRPPKERRSSLKSCFRPRAPTR